MLHHQVHIVSINICRVLFKTPLSDRERVLLSKEIKSWFEKSHRITSCKKFFSNTVSSKNLSFMSSNQINSISSRIHRQQETENRKIGNLVIFVTISYVICWLPFTAWTLYKSYLEDNLRVSSHYRPPSHNGPIMKKKKGSVMRFSRHTDQACLGYHKTQ